MREVEVRIPESSHEAVVKGLADAVVVVGASLLQCRILPRAWNRKSVESLCPDSEAFDPLFEVFCDFTDDEREDWEEESLRDSLNADDVTRRL